MEKFESGMEKIWLRDKHPGSATLAVGMFYMEAFNNFLSVAMSRTCWPLWRRPARCA
jgi:hypothetical protein